MKVAITILLTIGFIGITVFGAFAMSHDSEPGHSGCIAATTQGTDCPDKKNALWFLNFHLNAFRTFSTAIFLESIASAFLLLIASIMVFSLGVGINNYTPPALKKNYAREQFLESVFPQKRKLIRWLAIHENSPTI